MLDADPKGVQDTMDAWHLEAVAYARPLLGDATGSGPRDEPGQVEHSAAPLTTGRLGGSAGSGRAQKGRALHVRIAQGNRLCRPPLA
jgi:hypothetical protein